MRFTVELLAFGKPGEVREVDCKTVMAHPKVFETALMANATVAEAVCQEVFKWGQNKVQPQDHPSVSAGDVINIGEDKWLVMAAGFQKLSSEEYNQYRSMTQEKRLMCIFDKQGPPPPMTKGKL